MAITATDFQGSVQRDLASQASTSWQPHRAKCHARDSFKRPIHRLEFYWVSNRGRSPNVSQLSDPAQPPLVPRRLPRTAVARPDIGSGRQLAAAHGDIGGATSDLFEILPHGAAGFEASLRVIGSERSQFWSVVRPCNWLIFDAGRIREYQTPKRPSGRGVATYDKTVLTPSRTWRSFLVVYAKEQRAVAP